MLKLPAFFCSVALALMLAPGSAAEEKPWSLRDHYTFENEQAAFSYDVQTSEWKIEVEGLGAVIDGMQAEIEFSAGSAIRVSDLEFAGEERTTFSGDMGEGTHFRSLYIAERGVAVRYTVKRFSNRPFLILQMEVRNEGDRPAYVSALRPVVAPPGSIVVANSGMRASAVHTRQRGGFPVLHEEDAASLLRLQFESPALTIGLGVLQTGMKEASVTISDDSGQWQGAIESRFDPPVRLLPGDSIAADSTWIAFMGHSADGVQQFHSWSQSVLPTSRRQATVPLNWVTVENGSSAESLYDAARAWRGREVRHALVPPGWEERAGTLIPNSPAYPGDMRLVPETLNEIGTKPGISLDPLAPVERSQNWTLPADGSLWLNGSNAKAIEYGVTRMRQVARWGFEFFVLEPSPIPDEILKESNLTRLEADMLAFGIMSEAARGRPVLPSPQMTLSDELEKWRQAADTTMSYTEYGLIAGPIRFETQGLTNLSDELSSTMGRFAGPLEIVGLPEGKARRQIELMLKEPVWAADILSQTRHNALGHPR